VKILEYEEVGNTILVTTDNAARPVFAYPAEKFSRVDDLKKEINRSIAREEKRDARSKKDKLIKDFKEKGIKEKVGP